MRTAPTPTSPAFVPANWVAERLGMHPDTFRRIRPRLVKAGFPEPDPLLSRYLVDDVEAWIQKRRKVASSGELLAGGTNQEVNHDAL